MSGAREAMRGNECGINVMQNVSPNLADVYALNQLGEV